MAETTDERIRVLWVAKGLGQGGMERLLVTHAAFGDHTSFDYRAAYVRQRPHSVVAELQDLGVAVTRLESRRRWAADLVRLVRRERIDVVHFHSPLPASATRPLLRLMPDRPKLISTEHNRWDRYAWPTRLGNRLTCTLDDARLAVSEDCRRSMSRRAQRSAEVLIHGVDGESVRSHAADRGRARRDLGISDDVVLVGTVANLRAQKNYPLLIEAARLLRATRSDVRFVAIGQGPLESDLRSLLETADLGEGFRFLGFRPDVLHLMSAFDILCFTSDHEGLPVALMEGRALGLPVIATAAGGLVDHVEDQIDGILVPRGEAPGLKAAIDRLASGHELRASLATASAKRADDYRADSAVHRIEALYRTLAGRR